MVTVSVNVFDDADLLKGCLASVREQLPHARIQVIDGRYEAFPAPADNSTDATPQVCDAFGAEYWPDGPHADEPAKHYQRLDRAPDGERVLFLDADERLLAFDADALDAEAVYRVRIFNAWCYNGRVTYYARYFHPGQMADIPRVDRFWFGDHDERHTDAITIAHRADLRDGDYYAAKNARLKADGRTWYDDYLDRLDRGAVTYATETCPECGRDTLRRSRVCGFGVDGGRPYTRVALCHDSDCYAAIEPYELGEWQYLPDAVDAGFDEDPERVRVELLDAGHEIAAHLSDDTFERYRPNAKLFVREAFDGDGYDPTERIRANRAK